MIPPTQTTYHTSSTGYGSGFGTGGSLTCSGEITTTLTWTPDPSWPDEPPPLSATVQEECRASASGLKVNSDAGSSASASADNGVGLSGSAVGVVSSDGSSTSYSVDYDSSRYSVRSGATITITCSPRADATSIPGAAVVNVSYNVTATPVVIGLGGVTNVDTADACVLTGQQVIASLSASPGHINVHTYNWSINNPSSIFSEWNKNSSALTLVPPNTGSSYAFYTRKEDAALMVHCDATLIFPDGTPGAVSAEVPIHSVKPVADWQVVSQEVRLNADPPDGPALASFFGAFSLKLDRSIDRLGQEWTAKFTIAAPFYSGEAAFLQLGTFTRYAYILNATAKPYRYKAPNAVEVLDTGFPY